MEQLKCKPGRTPPWPPPASTSPSSASLLRVVRILADVSDATLTVHPHLLHTKAEEEANKRRPLLRSEGGGGGAE